MIVFYLYGSSVVDYISDERRHPAVDTSVEVEEQSYRGKLAFIFHKDPKRF